MELNITQFFATECPRDYQASRAEIGDNAARDTWQAALECDAVFITADNADEFRAELKQYGAWDESEISAFTLAELNALAIQFISAEMRDAEGISGPSADNNCLLAWEVYRKASEAGRVSGLLSCDDTGRVFFYFGT